MPKHINDGPWRLFDLHHFVHPLHHFPQLQSSVVEAYRLYEYTFGHESNRLAFFSSEVISEKA